MISVGVLILVLDKIPLSTCTLLKYFQIYLTRCLVQTTVLTSLCFILWCYLVHTSAPYHLSHVLLIFTTTQLQVTTTGHACLQPTATTVSWHFLKTCKYIHTYLCIFVYLNNCSNNCDWAWDNQSYLLVTFKLILRI